jgi:hypothetical protein
MPRYRVTSTSEITRRRDAMRGLVLWFLGVPFSVIVLLYLFNVL